MSYFNLIFWIDFTIFFHYKTSE